MINPFKIFPSIGYKNSQFQVISSVDNLTIDIFDNRNKKIKSVEVNSQYPTIISKLDSTGKLIAISNFNNQTFKQKIEIRDAFRLGSSEFKKAFVFDDTNFSFFLMKDRLLLYDEKKKIFLTENHYSPTTIHKINKSNYLFITKLGSNINEIINLGIYNTDTFSIVGELLNKYKEIRILPDSNKVWLFNVNDNTIHCFELVKKNESYFSELIKFTGFKDFFIDKPSQNIFINYNDKLIISDFNNIHNTIEIPKLSNNAIDEFGNIFTIENNVLTCTKLFTHYYTTIKLSSKLNLQSDNFVHIGEKLKNEIKLTDLNEKIEKTKNNIIPSIPKNKTFYKYILPKSDIISDSYSLDDIYLTIDGIFIIHKEIERNFKGIKFKKVDDDDWTATEITTIKHKYSLFFNSSNVTEILIDKVSFFSINKYHNSILLVNTLNENFLFSGKNKLALDKEKVVNIFTVNEITYFLIKSKDYYSLYQNTNIKKPILEKIIILNLNLIEKHQIIWYIDNNKSLSNSKYINAFDLQTRSPILIDKSKIQHSLFKNVSDIQFYDAYALSSNKLIFNPKNLEIKDSFVGKIESYSKSLDKIISHRINTIYLSKFNYYSGKYKLTEIPIDEQKFNESYLSPNGQFLVLQDKSNEYVLYDIEKNETLKFFSGNFLAFSNEGNLIIEKDSTRNIKIVDPLTLDEITPLNYQYYRFLSPDGKLYAQTSKKVRYLNRLNGLQLTLNEVIKLRRDLDIPNYPLSITPEKKTRI